jgi:hypothetical protein
MQAKITTTISLFFIFLFWLFLLLGLRITDLSVETDFNIVVGIFAVIGFIFLSKNMKQALWKAILRSVMLSTVLLSFLLVLLAPTEILDESAEGYPPRCEVASPNGQKTFAVKARIPSEGASDFGWIYYKNLPFMGKEVDPVRYCSSRWINNDTIAVPASSYYGTPEQTIYAGIEFNWFSLSILAVVSLFSYFAIKLFGFFFRKKNVHSQSS